MNEVTHHSIHFVVFKAAIHPDSIAVCGLSGSIILSYSSKQTVGEPSKEGVLLRSCFFFRAVIWQASVDWTSIYSARGITNDDILRDLRCIRYGWKDIFGHFETFLDILRQFWTLAIITRCEMRSHEAPRGAMRRHEVQWAAIPKHAK